MSTPNMPVTLGLCSFTHDSAAALVVDGHLVGMVEEERLSGSKHTSEYPEQAIAWLLEITGLTAADINLVAYNLAGRRYLAGVMGSGKHLLQSTTRGRALPRAASYAVVHARYRRRMELLRKKFPNAKVRSIEHHVAHGLYSFATSGYERAAVLVADSLGEIHTTSIGHAYSAGDNVDYRIAETISDPQSLGYAYGAVTEHLGWRRGDEEGTVMALAALGDPARFRDLMSQAIRITRKGFNLDPSLLPIRVLRHGWPRVTTAFVRATCLPRHADEAVSQLHVDLAAALQERTEQVMVHLARRARQITGSRLLCIGGGVALNCVAIGNIISNRLFDEIFVPPAPGDSGTCIGAAIAAHLEAVNQLPTGVIHSCFLGPAYPTFQPGPAPLPDLSARQIPNAASFLASQLGSGKIVGLFQGRLEAGPRALGHRSILASPLLPNVVDRLNKEIKFREPFRPFAPVVLASEAANYFQISQSSPYMSIAVPAKALAHQQVPAVVHANDTARVQTLDPADDPFLAQVLEHFYRQTGVPILINTSLNIKGKPICGTPQMALQCLAATKLDGLMLDNGWWVTQ